MIDSTKFQIICILLQFILVARANELRIAAQTENDLTLTPPYQWIHPEKTGSSFGNELFALTCPEQMAEILLAYQEGRQKKYSIIAKRGIKGIAKSCQEKWHFSNFDRVRRTQMRPEWIIGDHYTWSPEVQESSTFITLRSPTNRIRSLTEWLFRFCTRENLEKVNLNMRGRVKKHSHRVRTLTYVDYLTGSTKLNSREKKSLAIERLKFSAWIGLTDYFNASICLLSNLYPHHSHPNSHVNMRKTTLKTTSFSKMKNGYACSPRNIQKVFGSRLQDDIDVYIHAVGVFSERLMKHAPQCAKFITTISPYEPLQAKYILENLRSVKNFD